MTKEPVFLSPCESMNVVHMKNSKPEDFEGPNLDLKEIKGLCPLNLNVEF